MRSTKRGRVRGGAPASILLAVRAPSFDWLQDRPRGGTVHPALRRVGWVVLSALAVVWFGAMLGAEEDGPTFREAKFRLRRIREEAYGVLCLSRRGVVAYETTIERRPPDDLPGPDIDVGLVFDVPASAGGTRLSASPPEYWLFDVVADTSAGKYAESFLVPIYDRPAA